LEGISAAERAAIAEQFSARYSTQQVRVTEAMQRLLQHPECLKIISDEVQKMPGIGGNR